jgi:hypothetical protein
MNNSRIDNFMINHEAISDSSDDELDTNFRSKIIKQMGGDPKIDMLKDAPTGSFPPIYFLSKEEKQKEEKIRDRSFSAPSKKIALSIKEIMQERRDDKNLFIDI